MKNMKLRKIICLLLVTCSSCSFFAGCTDDINNYEKQTAAEASNKVFILSLIHISEPTRRS